MSDTDGFDGTDFDRDGSIDSEDQLQPEDTLVDRGVDDVLDEGYSPPDREPSAVRHLDEEETLDERLAEEEPDPTAGLAEDEGPQDSYETDLDSEDEVGNRRAGRIVAPDEGSIFDTESELVGSEVGIDGAGASAEEAAVHYIDEDEADR